MSIHDCGFYFVTKRHGQFLFIFNMGARSSKDIYISGGMGRARVLIEAIKDLRRRERGWRSPCPPPMVQRGRAGAPGMIR